MKVLSITGFFVSCKQRIPTALSSTFCLIANHLLSEIDASDVPIEYVLVPIHFYEWIIIAELAAHIHNSTDIHLPNIV